MTQLKLSFLFTIFMSMVGVKALAYDIAVENDDGITIYYNYINDNKELEVVSRPITGYSGIVNIPEEVNYKEQTYRVTSIGYDAFYDCSGLTSITIPNGVTNFGESAFSGCSSLTSVTIPNSVTSIGDCVFNRCSGLTSIEIPNSVTSIGRSAFYDCSGLTSVTIGNSVTSIGDYAFSYCTGLTSINVESGNTTYDSRNNSNAIIDTATNTLIHGCQNTIIPNSVTSIGGGAFRGCTGLTSVTIPNSVTSIGGCAFYDCSGLTSITIPNSVTSISNGVFSGCISLTSIEIPNSVTSIGSTAFWDCSLTSITIPNSVTSIGKEAFYNCRNLTSVTIPNSVTSIGESTFHNCSGLTSITIPNSVTSIGNQAFYKCSGLTSIIIPSSVTSIDDFAFLGCSGLYDFFCYAKDVPTTNSYAFYDLLLNNITLHVPAESIKKYSSVEPWKSFKLIVPLPQLIYKVDGEIYKSMTPMIGDVIVPEEALAKEGYTFSGWSEIPETMPAEDVTITGTFAINKYKLTYKVDGEAYKIYDIDYSTSITPETAPTKEGYTFSGWSDIPETMPAHDVTVTGTFAINQYTITYKIDDEVYQTESVDYGSTITPPNAPEREGYTFEWIDVPETMPAHDITIVGSYTSGINAIRMEAENGKVFDLKGRQVKTPGKGIYIFNGQKVVVK